MTVEEEQSALVLTGALASSRPFSLSVEFHQPEHLSISQNILVVLDWLCLHRPQRVG